VKITINAGAGLPTDCIKVECWADWDNNAVNEWWALGFSGWGTSQLTTSYGPAGGFNCTPGWDQTTPIRVMFEGNAPITGYNVDMFVEQQ
jgi:hypothetical protein